MLGNPPRYLSTPPTITQPNLLPFLHPKPRTHLQSPFPFPTHLQSPKPKSPPRLFAQNTNSNPNSNNLSTNTTNNNGNNNNNNNDEDDLLPSLKNIKWGDLLLDPDPDNILAVGLTGLLTWASVQVLWNLFFIALAILVAALKYSFIAAFLIVILITLL